MHSWSERDARILAAAAAVIAGAMSELGAELEPAAAERLAVGLTARLDALLSDRLFSELPAALREAELQALQITLAIYESGLKPGEAGKAGRSFHEAAVAFSASELATIKALSSKSVRRRDGEGSAVAPATLLQARRAAEEGLLVDLDVAVGARALPDRFLGLFLDVAQERTGWFEAFGLYVAWHVRSDRGLQEALCAEPPEALDGSGLTMAGVLETMFQSAKQTALRLEARLAQAETDDAEAGESENREIAAFLERLPQVVANRHRVPEPAMQAAAEALRGTRADPGNLESLLERQARRLKEALALLAATYPQSATPEGAAGARSAAMLREGRFAEAGEALKAVPASASRMRAVAFCSALAGDWARARVAFNDALGSVAAAEAATACATVLDLAEVLEDDPDPLTPETAVQLFEAVLAVGSGQLRPQRHAAAAIGLAAAAKKLLRGPRQLKALTSAVDHLDRLPNDLKGKLDPATRARLACARGDLQLALVAHGADRTGEAAAAFDEALAEAHSAGDVRIVSDLWIRRAEIMLLGLRGKSPDEAAALRATALSHLQSAQQGRLRTRDPMLWAEVKLRTADALTAGAGGATDPRALKSALVAAKAALRLLEPWGEPTRLARVLTRIGDICAAMTRAEGTARWREHALAAYRAALAVTDASAFPEKWSHLNACVAGQLYASLDAAEAETLAEAVSHYRAALSAGAAKSPRKVRVRRQLADALAAYGKRRIDVEALAEAAALYRDLVATDSGEAGGEVLVQCCIKLGEVVRDMIAFGSPQSATGEHVSFLQEQESRLRAPGGRPQLAGRLTAVLKEIARSQAKLGAPPLGPEMDSVARLLLSKSG
jgi:hypothetical protein